MNEKCTLIVTARIVSIQSGESLKQSVVNTMPCLLQELGYQALLYTNKVLL